MSDIFCKTKFKPIISSTAAIIEPAAVFDRNQAFFSKRSSSSSSSATALQEDYEREAPASVKFVNSQWTPSGSASSKRAKVLILHSEPRSNRSDSSSARLHSNRNDNPFGQFLKRAKRQASTDDSAASDLKNVLSELPKGTLVRRIDPKMTELLLSLLRNTNASQDFSKKKITNVYYVYFPTRNGTQPSDADSGTVNFTATRNRNTDLDDPSSSRRRVPSNRNRPDEVRRPILRERTTLIPRNRVVTTPVPVRATRPSTTTTSTTTTTTEAPAIISALQPQLPQLSPQKPIGGFMLTEQDYNFAEQLCEGRFSGGIADPRHACKLYFECNPSTIDTFACPDGYAFDNRRQLCLQSQAVTCPRI